MVTRTGRSADRSSTGAARRTPVAATTLLTTGLMTAALVASGTVPAVAASSPTVRARVSSHDVTDGERVRLGGRVLADRAGGRVALQERRPGGRWVRRGLVRTNQRGGFRFVMTPDEGRHVYRVRAWRHAGQRPGTSPRRVVRVAAADAGTPDTTGIPDTPTTGTTPLDEVRREVLDATNAARRQAGKPALRMKGGLHVVAQRWTAAMAATGELSHNPSYASQVPDGWTRVAENVAYGYEPDEVVDAWMDSPGHRANLLGDYTHLGVGFVRDDRGRAWFTQNFGRY